MQDNPDVQELAGADVMDIARIVFRPAGTDVQPPVPLSSTERAAIAASKAAAARGEFADDEQVRAARAKHRL